VEFLLKGDGIAFLVGPGRLCQHNFKHNRLSIFGEIYAGIIGTFSHLNGNNRLD